MEGREVVGRVLRVLVLGKVLGVELHLREVTGLGVRREVHLHMPRRRGRELRVPERRLLRLLLLLRVAVLLRGVHDVGVRRERRSDRTMGRIETSHLARHETVERLKSWLLLAHENCEIGYTHS